MLKNGINDCIPIEFNSLVPNKKKSDIKTCEFPREELFPKIKLIMDNASRYCQSACTHYEYSGITDTLSGIDDGKKL